VPIHKRLFLLATLAGLLRGRAVRNGIFARSDDCEG
jgi:hypothetical protein